MARRSKHPAVAALEAAVPAGMDNFASDANGPLQQESNAHYDAYDAALRAAPDVGGFNNTMAIMNNQASKISPWAPWLQAVGGDKFSQDTARPQGLADDPAWAASGDAGALAKPVSYPQSTNIGTPNPAPARYNPDMPESTDAFIARTRGPMNGLRKAGFATS